MARARKGTAIQSKIGMVIYGEQFTGKSTMAMQLAYFKRPDGKPFRVLYLDPESGSIDDYLPELEANGVNPENVYIVYTQSLAEVRQYISKVKNHEDFYELDDDGNETTDIVLDADGEPFRADALVIDGTTVLNMTTKQGLVEFSKKRNKVKANKDGLIGEEKLVKIEGAGLELKDYNTINMRGQDLILDLMGCGVHFVVTAREEDEKESVRTPEGQITSVPTGRKKPAGFKDMGYNAKTVVRMFRSKDDGSVCAHIEKDRTHVHEDNAIIEDPTLLDWQAVIDKTAGNKEFIVKNNFSGAINIEHDIYAKEVLGDEAAETMKAEAEAEANGSNGTTADDIKEQISAYTKKMAAPAKAEMKKKLTELGLPVAFKSVADVDILTKILEVVSK